MKQSDWQRAYEQAPASFTGRMETTLAHLKEEEPMKKLSLRIVCIAAAAVLAVLCAVVLVFWMGNLSTPVTAEEAGIWLYNKKEDGANLCVLEVQGENVRLETEGGFSWGKEYILSLIHI